MSGRNDEQLLAMKDDPDTTYVGQLIDEVIWLREHHRKHHDKQREMRKAGDALRNLLLTGAACSEGIGLVDAWDEARKS